MAHIDPSAKIGENVTIDPFVFIDKDVVIGDDCHIASHACLYAGTRLGKRVQVFPGAVIGAIPQDLKFAGEYSTATVGDDTVVREYVTINRGTIERKSTDVGKNCLLMAYVHIAHDCHVGNNVILANNVNLAGHVKIADHAILEGLVAVQQFIRIGQHSFVAGGSLVRKDIPPYVKAAREPISFAGTNRIGLQRRGFSDANVEDIAKIYRILFKSGLNTSNALEKIKAEMNGSIHSQEIVEFIKSSQKGIMRGFNA
ncbi:UNVERIFIED_CONTAM: hypothetical protein GTU68_063571 [Idotea baltica]|nr:hypothetical protein [Idotea baltica]